MSIKLVRDKDSFAKPFDIAINEVVKAVLEAGNPIRGAEQRVRIALAEKNDLDNFYSQMTELLKGHGFRDLPKLFQESRALPNCHHLTVGPWRGIFLVDPSSEFVVALVFSKEPHQLESRLDELVKTHQPTPERPEP